MLARYLAERSRVVRYALDPMSRRHLGLMLRGGDIPRSLPDHSAAFNYTLARLFSPAAQYDSFDLAGLADQLQDAGNPLGEVLAQLHAGLTTPEGLQIQAGLSQYPLFRATPGYRPVMGAVVGNTHVGRFPGFNAVLQAAKQPVGPGSPLYALNPFNTLHVLSPLWYLNDVYRGGGPLGVSLGRSREGLFLERNPLAILPLHDAASHIASGGAGPGQNGMLPQYGQAALDASRHLINTVIMPHLAAVGRGESQP